MGLTDGVLGYFQHRAFIKGADWFGVGQALENAGHFGLAVRCYDEAIDLFGRAEDNNMYKAIGRKKVCLKKAQERGEEVAVASQFNPKEIKANPEDFIQSYYQGQSPEGLLNRFQVLYRYQQWNSILKTADAAKNYLKRTSEQTRISGDYNVAYFSGIANLRMDNLQEAVSCLRTAYDTSRRFGLVAETLAWDAMHLGEALLKFGDETCEKFLKEAIHRFSTFIASGQDWAHEPKRDAMDMLASIYMQRLNEKYTTALEAARNFAALDIDSKLPEEYQVGSVWNATSQRTQAFLNSHELCERIEGHLLHKEYGLGFEILAEVNPVSKSAAITSLTKRINELHRELMLSDPGHLTHHTATVQKLLQEYSFCKADKLCAELESRHPGNPQVETIARSIMTAKHSYVDKHLMHADQLIREKNADGAEEAYNIAMRTAQPIGYEPTTGTEVRARLSRLRAVQWGLQAQEFGKQGNYKKAFDLLRLAIVLPSLSADITAKLQKILAVLQQNQHVTANSVYKKIECMLKAQKWEQAQEFAQKAIEQGSGTRLAPLVERVRRHFKGMELVAEAQNLVQNRKYHAAIKKADVAITFVFQDTSLSQAAGDVKEDAEQMLSRIVDNLASDAVSNLAATAAIILGLAAIGLLWWLADIGLLYSVWLGFTIFVSIVGILVCACTGSVFVHNANSHGLSWAICGPVAFGLSWVLPWWVAALIALGCFCGADWLLGRYCPAQDPTKDPEEPDSVKTSSELDSGSTE